MSMITACCLFSHNNRQYAAFATYDGQFKIICLKNLPNPHYFKNLASSSIWYKKTTPVSHNDRIVNIQYKNGCLFLRSWDGNIQKMNLSTTQLQTLSDKSVLDFEIENGKPSNIISLKGQQLSFNTVNYLTIPSQLQALGQGGELLLPNDRGNASVQSYVQNPQWRITIGRLYKQQIIFMTNQGNVGIARASSDHNTIPWLVRNTQDHFIDRATVENNQELPPYPYLLELSAESHLLAFTGYIKPTRDTIRHTETYLHIYNLWNDAPNLKNTYIIPGIIKQLKFSSKGSRINVLTEDNLLQIFTINPWRVIYARKHIATFSYDEASHKLLTLSVSDHAGLQRLHIEHDALSSLVKNIQVKLETIVAQLADRSNKNLCFRISTALEVIKVSTHDMAAINKHLAEIDNCLEIAPQLERLLAQDITALRELFPKENILDQLIRPLQGKLEQLNQQYPRTLPFMRAQRALESIRSSGYSLTVFQAVLLELRHYMSQHTGFAQLIEKDLLALEKFLSPNDIRLLNARLPLDE